MKKVKLNDFEKMCSVLEQWSDGENMEPIDMARKALKEYVNDDKDKLMKIKAQANKGDYFVFVSQNMAAVALLISFIGLLVSGLKDIMSMYFPVVGSIVCFTYIVIAGCCTVCLLRWVQKFSFVNSWRCYILVVIEEMEKKMFSKKRK